MRLSTHSMGLGIDGVFNSTFSESSGGFHEYTSLPQLDYEPGFFA
jgi:hypothetical protein